MSVSRIKPTIFDKETFRIDKSLVHFAEPPPLWKKVLIPIVFSGFFSIYSALVLIFGDAFSKRFKAKILPSIMSKSDRLTKDVKKELLKSIRGNVLDLGAGAGGYIEHIKPTVTKYVALEPNIHLHETIHRRWDECFPPSSKKECPSLEICGDFLHEYVSSGRGKPGTFDYIILGNVMCEIKNPREILHLVDILLKPETGRVYFCEHVLADAQSMPRLCKIQQWIDPWWSFVSECHCNRDTLNYMRQVCPHWDIVHWTFYPIGLMPWNAVFEMGLAVSKKKHI